MCRSLIVAGAAAAVALMSGPSPAITHNVEIHDDFFSPATLVVTEGDSVRWTHMGFHPHTVDQNAEAGSCMDMFGGFSSGMMIPAEVFVWGAAGVGNAYYHCDFHCPTMVGTITVEESTPVEAATWGTVKALYH